MSGAIAAEQLSPIHGVMAEFETPEDLIAAGESAYSAGYRRMDAYAPMPVAGLAEAIGYRKNYVANCVLVGGCCGVLFGLGLLEWISCVAYPLNVGGRPLNSWPSFIPITFECMILFSSLTALFSMLAMNGLPRPYHPVFNVPAFERASVDRFFLCIESTDPNFSETGTAAFLRDQPGAREVSVVAA
jgi:Protein of unknown function (DUF3341)